MKDIHLREYQAFDTKDRRQRSLQIRRKGRERDWLKYVDLHVMRLSPDDTVLTIFFYSITLILIGRNLGGVADAIDGEHAAWIQEFDGVRFDRPADELAPVIESVELFEPKRATRGEEDGGG